MMTATIVSFRWLDLLEKEFDKSFVDLELIFGEVEDVDEFEWSNQVRTKLGAISSCFAQLAHKAQTIFQTNAKLEAELVNLRHELIQTEASFKISKEENHDMLLRLHSSQLQLFKQQANYQEFEGDSSNVEVIKERLERQIEEERLSRLALEIPRQEVLLLRKENEVLRKHILALQGELSGAKLTSKYLDKELAGRIQQLQLLSREMKGEQHEKLWKQLEAEIHLHRHKTVVRACRTNNIGESKAYANGISFPPKPPENQSHRIVTLHKEPHQNLGMSITGGREHGVPILISVLHDNLPASTCQELYVGDAIIRVNSISLKEVTHNEAVDILSSQEGEITFEVVFISPEEDDEEDGSLADDPFSYKYRLFDEEVDSTVSSVHLAQNGRLSRASIDSVRGSTDNILASPRKGLRTTLEHSEEDDRQSRVNVVDHLSSQQMTNEEEGSISNKDDASATIMRPSEEMFNATRDVEGEHNATAHSFLQLESKASIEAQFTNSISSDSPHQGSHTLKPEEPLSVHSKCGLRGGIASCSSGGLGNGSTSVYVHDRVQLEAAAGLGLRLGWRDRVQLEAEGLGLRSGWRDLTTASAEVYSSQTSLGAGHHLSGHHPLHSLWPVMEGGALPTDHSEFCGTPKTGVMEPL